MKIRLPKTSTMVATAAIAIGLTAGGVGVMHAASNADGANMNPMSNLVTAISTKFNLNQSEVQQVFDEQHQQMKASMQERAKQKLAQLVANGKLTQDQAGKIIAKQVELQAQHEAHRAAMEGKTPAEHKSAMEAERAALKQWAKDNNIPMQYLHFGHGHGMGGHMGGMKFNN